MNKLKNCRRKYVDKSEITPFLNSSSTTPPTVLCHSGTATVNRTLLHHQQQHNTLGSVHSQKNGTTATIRGFEINCSSESPPPDYNMVHDTRRHDISFFVSLFLSF